MPLIPEAVLSVRHCLLAILNQGPCYGYQLRTEFDRRTGGGWSLNVGQIYKTLDRLERDGLAERAQIEADGQNYYQITDAGSLEVENWLGSAVPRSVGARDGVPVKLAMALTLPGVDAGRVIVVEREALQQRIEKLESNRDSTDATSSHQLAAQLVADSLLFEAESDLRWLRHAESRLVEASAAGLADPLPLTAETPKRGRPARALPAKR